MTLEWQPSARLAVIKKRAQLLQELRAFFLAREVLEVDVPVLGSHTVTDPHLQAIPAQVNGTQHYLQTSPEFYMKRLLAAGVGSCFYLGKAFRQDEQGKRHRPEFTMLEWYRLGFDDTALRAEVLALFQCLSVAITADTANIRSHQLSYGELFQQKLALDPHSATADDLARVAATRLDVHWPSTDKSTWLDLLFSHCIEPDLQDLTIVYDYPECQCALARVSKNAAGQAVAKRFEVFWRGMELANGYWELTNAHEQAARFAEDNRVRQQMGLPSAEPDHRLLAALDAGLPACAGVALGVDRLLMCLTGASSIDEVVPF